MKKVEIRLKEVGNRNESNYILNQKNVTTYC